MNELSSAFLIPQQDDEGYLISSVTLHLKFAALKSERYYTEYIHNT